LLFSAVISQHFSKNHMIIYVVAAKIWYLKKCTVFIGPPCILMLLMLLAKIIKICKTLSYLWSNLSRFAAFLETQCSYSNSRKEKMSLARIIIINRQETAGSNILAC